MNILKSAFARWAIQVNGARRITEYLKYIEKDAALERRLYPSSTKKEQDTQPKTMTIRMAIFSSIILVKSRQMLQTI